MPDYIFSFALALISALLGLLTFEHLPAVALCWLVQTLAMTGIGLWQLAREDAR